MARVQIPPWASPFTFIMNRTITLLLVGCLLTTAATPVAAQSSNSGLLDSMFSEATLSERISAANDAVGGLVDRLGYEVSSRTSLIGGQPDRNATAHADALASTYNNNSVAIEDYVNQRFDGDASQWDVIEIHVVDGDTETTRYLTADATSNDTFENTTMTANTSRSVDQTIEIRDYAAKNADDELQTFVDDYVTEDKDIDAALQQRLAQQYGGDIRLPNGVAA